MNRINCTLADIAKRMGLSTATVSLALRSNPRISENTRERVKKTAQSMGYRPDPLLSALVARRNKDQPHRTFSNIGVIRDKNWRLLPGKGEWMERVLKGMQESCYRLGYGMDVFCLQEDFNAIKAPDRLLEARGIRGLVLPSLTQEKQYLVLDWKRYAVVILGSHSIWPNFHRIATDFFAGMGVIYSKAKSLGYQRIGLAHSYIMEKTHRFEWLGAYLKEAYLRPHQVQSIPPHLPESLSEDNFLKWVKKYKPDCIVSNQQECLQFLQTGGWRVPEDVGFIYLSTTRPNERISAMVTNYALLGSTSIMQLHSLLLRGEYGIPKWQTETLVYPKWLGGKTTRVLHAKKRQK